MLDFSRDDTRAGFRLHRFEVLNWGTFDRHVWTLGLDGESGLLTGDIGSGKSTLVDALTTLLVPSHRITYNKAAGAETKERNLTSYVRGHYKSEKDDEALSAKAVALRDKHSYSVLLAHFYNEGYAQSVTLAQVFWSQDNQSRPGQFYVVSDAALSIAEDFADFGPEIGSLKRRLRKKAEVFDSFSQYSGEFRRRFGIQNAQALDLFAQTVSMKSVGNLTDFIRHHMLEAPPAQERLELLCQDFENLNRTYEAVRKAKAQIEALSPMVEACDRLSLQQAEHEGLLASRGALHAYFARQKSTLLVERIEKGKLELAKLEDRLAGIDQELRHLRQQAADLRRSIDDNGGRRLDEIAREIDRLSHERVRKAKLAELYRRDCDRLGVPFPDAADAFYRLRGDAERLNAALEAERQGLDAAQVEARVELKGLDERHQALARELASLRERRSNIPFKIVQLRRDLCATLQVDEDELPFAGELMRVAEGEAAWEGAAERLLHQFGLSLLVPDPLYHRVAKYVELTHLHGRLVYYRVKDGEALKPPRACDPASLVRKLQLKHDSPFYSWLEHQLLERFDYACTEDLAEFQRLPRAITPQGQIKGGGGRHEKDDRHRIDDRSRYVLGWTNQDKIRALEAQQAQLRSVGDRVTARLVADEARLKAVNERRESLRDLSKHEDFQEIHWQPLAGRIADLEEEKRGLEAASDVLRTLQAQLEAAERGIAEGEVLSRKVADDRADQRAKLSDQQEKHAEAEEALASLSEAERARLFPRLAEMQPEALPGKKISVENCNNSEKEMREWLQARIDAVAKRIAESEKSILRQMDQYKLRYPQETREVDASIEAEGEYRRMLSTLRREDLPRHEQNFKTLLNERTINGIALLQAWLEKERQEISDKIDTINRSLAEIEYGPGTYIELVGDRAQDPEIRAFTQDLRACLGDTLGGGEDELYAEHKFLQVKALIDRFNGREGFSELDRRWTQKVTDVRNWFVFSASERWREDGKEKEFYSDSAGKSGGQKEKLAYTILASALAYQFGLEWGEVRSRTFRFVMIDEAFGRGSDESARYGLELFKKLNLQLLIVTPLQKIHVIEDYVQSVHYVHNEGGRNSKVHSLTIDAYRAEKARDGEEAIAAP